MPERSFLTAEWRSLVMLNYEFDPATLTGRVPAGCELDTWDGCTFVSVVGFRFLDTRVFGVSIPFHRNFEEVNLRFYVRRKVDGAWRRGVVFVKELVPRWAIAAMARGLFGENYVSLPMRHELQAMTPDSLSVTYRWFRDGTWESIAADFSGVPAIPGDESEETFITEHYWGYAAAPGRHTVEYGVEHPRWRVWRADAASFDCDAGSLYGPEFRDALTVAPRSSFVAEGSPVVVRYGRRLA